MQGKLLMTEPGDPSRDAHACHGSWRHEPAILAALLPTPDVLLSLLIPSSADAPHPYIFISERVSGLIYSSWLS